MAKGKQLSSHLKSRIVAKYQAENSHSKISEKPSVVKSTIQSIIKKYVTGQISQDQVDLKKITLVLHGS